MVADRIPAGKSLISPPSHCFKCGRRLELRDLIPIVSYIQLRGKCRFCGEKISCRSLLVEAVTGTIFILAWLQLGWGWQLLSTLILCCIFIVVFIIDLENTSVPGIIMYPAIAIALALAAGNQYLSGGPGIISSISGFALGMGIFLAIWLISRLFKKNIIAFSDATIMGLIGASVGFPLIILALYLAVLAGGMSVVMLIIFKLRKWNEHMPFGPFASTSAVLVLIWGNNIWQWCMKV